MTAPHVGLRVLHVNDDLEVGGIERLIVTYAGELGARSMRIGVAARDGGPLWEELPSFTVQYRLSPREGLRGVFRYVLGLRRIVRRDGWDVLHAHQRALTLIARIALLGTGVRVVEHVHSTFAPKGVKRALSFRGHHVIAVGSAGKKMIVDEFGRAATRVSVVRNTVRDPGWGTVHPPPSAAGSAPRVVGVGRAVDEKDPLRFLRVVRILQQGIPDLSAEWVGAGPLLEEMRAYVDTQDMGSVVLDGESSEVSKKLCAADALLVTSRQEGLPLTILEAIAAGRAVVSSDVGSCSDLVVAGSTGLLFPPSFDDEAVAAVVENYLASGQHIADGRRARSFYEEHCGVETMIDALVDVYDRVMLQ